MEKFRKDIKCSLVKMSIRDPDLLYEALDHILYDQTDNNEIKDYEFGKIDQIIFDLANKWIIENNKKRILFTFLLLYRCHSMEKVRELFIKKDFECLKMETINRYRTEAISDIKKYLISDKNARNSIKKAIEEQYGESAKRYKSA